MKLADLFFLAVCFGCFFASIRVRTRIIEAQREGNSEREDAYLSLMAGLIVCSALSAFGMLGAG